MPELGLLSPVFVGKGRHEINGLSQPSMMENILFFQPPTRKYVAYFVVKFIED